MKRRLSVSERKLRIIVGNLNAISEEWVEADDGDYELITVTQVSSIYTMFLVKRSTHKLTEEQQNGFDDVYGLIQG